MKRFIDFINWMLDAAKCKIEKEQQNSMKDRLDRIESKVDKIRRVLSWQFSYMIGLGAIAVAIGLLNLPSDKFDIDPKGALALLVFGAIIVIVMPLIGLIKK